LTLLALLGHNVNAQNATSMGATSVNMNMTRSDMPTNSTTDKMVITMSSSNNTVTASNATPLPGNNTMATSETAMMADVKRIEFRPDWYEYYYNYYDGAFYQYYFDQY